MFEVFQDISAKGYNDAAAKLFAFGKSLTDNYIV